MKLLNCWVVIELYIHVDRLVMQSQHIASKLIVTNNLLKVAILRFQRSLMTPLR